MGGVRQFNVLLRKNLLLKTRRPCATCLELSLPIVLFLLLAYVRGIYEIKTYGPFFFERGPIFPFNSLLFGEDPGSQGLVDIQNTRASCTSECVWPWNATEDLIVRQSALDASASSAGQDSTSQFSNLLEDMEASLVCSSDMPYYMAEALEPVLKTKWGNETVEEWIMSQSPSERAAYIKDRLLELQAEDYVNKTFAEAERMRDEYLASRWRARIEEIAERIDQELFTLQAELDDWDPTVNAMAPQTARERAESWIDDVCSLRIWNETKAPGWTFSLENWSFTLNETNIVDGLEMLSRALEDQRLLDGVSLAEDLRRVADALIANASAQTRVDVTRLARELQDLETALALPDLLDWSTNMNLTLNETALAWELARVADALEALPGMNWTINAATLAEDLAMMSDALERSNWSDWIRSNASYAVSQLADWLDHQNVSANLEDAQHELSEMLESMDVSPVVSLVNDGAWWLSHFLKTRSATARLLGELPGDAFWNLEELGNPSSLGEAMQEGVDWLRERLASDDWSSELQEALDKLQAELETNRTLTLPGTWGSNHTWPDFLTGHNLLGGLSNLTSERRWPAPDASAWSGNISSWLNDLSRFLDNLTNRTAESIRLDLIPEWEGQWRAECPRMINKTAVGERVERMARGCPFYKDAVKHLREMRAAAAERVREAHRWLEEWNITQIRRHAERLQDALRDVDPDEVENFTSRVLSDVRTRVRSGEDGEDTSCLQYAECYTLQDEKQCLQSRESRWEAPVSGIPIKDEPCVWCGGEPCTSSSDMKCEPRRWLLEGEGSAFDSFLAKASYSVAGKSCGVAGHLANELLDEWKAHRNLACSSSSSSSNSDSQNPATDASGPGAGPGSYIQDEILRRKVLIAPYKGEVKKLFDLMLVEFTEGIMKPPRDSSYPGYEFFQALFRCPVMQASVAGGLKFLLQDRILFMDSEDEVDQYARSNPNDVLLAIVFRSADPATGDFPAGEVDVEYAIRLHAQLLPSTSQILRQARGAMWGQARITSYPYLQLFFAHLQEVFGRAAARLQALRSLAGDDSTEISKNIQASNLTALGRRMSVGVEQFPAPQYDNDEFIRLLQHPMPQIMILGWIYAVSLLVKEIVYEKQERLRDVMRIMGLKTWVYWSSWMASALIQMIVLASLIAIILTASNVIMHSDPTVILVFFMLYSLATVSLALCISSFFSSAKVAAACGGLGYYVCYMPYSLFNRFDDTLGTNGKNTLCLLSSSGLGVGMAMVAKWEVIEVGAQWDNLFVPPPVTYSGSAPKDDHSLGHVWMMLIVDTVLYQVLAWYIEKVFPGTLGLPQPWYFPVLPSYWFPNPSTISTDVGTIEAGAEQEENKQLECWEAPPDGLDITVQIRKLTKIFRNGKQALRGVSLDMHKGTIVGLLGHNGAGKSTTMSILTGLYPPTSGDVRVNGVSVCKDSLGVRKQLGVCLQHNALYENITVEEHLRLFCCLKSVPWDRMRAEVDGLLHDTGLLAKRHFPTRALSGGMKRKLSIGIALAGGSSVITLDEPTAGVDATSRRDIWQLLATHKVGRTILLSTHFMDEADILSDRIAIIAEGQLTAIGTSLSLKRKFADGYMLTVVVRDGANVPRLAESILEAVPEARFAGARGREIGFILPFESRGRFPALFSQLQDDKVQTSLGVDTYGLSAATMEEVFLNASSVHEEGLHGRVRNAVEGAATSVNATAGADDDSTAEGSSTEGGSDKGKAGKANGTSSDNLGGGDDDKDSGTSKNPTAEEPRPQSPQCLVGGNTPRAPRDVPKVDPNKLDGSRPATPPSTAASSHDETPQTSSKNEIADMPTIASGKMVSGTTLWLQRFDALFRKRALSVRRDRRAWASQVLLPAVFILMALIIARILEVREEEPPLKLSSDMFLGTTSAGAVMSTLDRNTFHISGTRDTPLAAQVEAAFVASASASETDAWEYFPERNGTLSEFYMENTRQVTSNFGAISVRESGEDVNMTLWFNNKGYHIIPVMVNMWNNARFRLLGFEGAKVQVWSHPLPKTQALIQEELSGSSQIFTDLTVAITVIIAMGFIPASFVVYLVHEKATSGKHQQLLTGITPLMYWVNSYVWDMFNFLIPLFICFLIFITFQVGAYSGGNSIAVFLLLLFYGACMTPCMYCIEPFFTVPSTAYVTLIVTNIFTGTLSTLAVTVMELYQNEIPGLKPATDFLKAVLPWALPNFCLGRGLLDIAMNHYLNYAAEEFGLCIRPGGECTVSPLTWDVAGHFLFTLFVMAPVFMSLRLLIEWGFFARGIRLRASRLLGAEGGWKGGSAGEDEAVVKEARRIVDTMAAAKASGASMADHLVLTDLAKTFTKRRCGIKRGKPFHAVRGINVGVPAGECFGLLGVNGAGKTTTMRMITGDTEITRGDILVGGYSTHTNRDRARQHLGYCPQFDALPDKLTVRETVALYARIRGVPSDCVRDTVDSMIKRMCLEAHQYNLCENLSGGNKRKLSTALALIGAPDVVLLDEPSTGVDVGARRFLWEVIGDIRRSGHAVVLTSHSMEECEVLCTRLTIMVHGQLHCLGSPTELKTKFGGGYTMAVKVNLKRDQFSGSACGADPCQLICSFISKEIPLARLVEESVGLYRYRLGDQGSHSSIPLAEIFKKLEEATKDGGTLSGYVSDYSLSQTSLEEVFLHFSQVGEREFAALNGATVELPTAGRPVQALGNHDQQWTEVAVSMQEEADAPRREI